MFEEEEMKLVLWNVNGFHAVLNKNIRGAIAKYSISKNNGGKTKYKPIVSKVIFDRNTKLNRDKDQIACEYRFYASIPDGIFYTSYFWVWCM